MTDATFHLATDKSPCSCYECVGPKYEYTENGDRVLVNNFKDHTLLEPCTDCGRPRTEYRDLGRKGYYVCWWCHHRAADSDDPRDP